MTLFGFRKSGRLECVGTSEVKIVAPKSNLFSAETVPVDSTFSTKTALLSTTPPSLLLFFDGGLECTLVLEH